MSTDLVFRGRRDVLHRRPDEQRLQALLRQTPWEPLFRLNILNLKAFANH